MHLKRIRRVITFDCTHYHLQFFNVASTPYISLTLSDLFSSRVAIFPSVYIKQCFTFK